MASIPTILTEISQADVNTTGLVRWLGTNGEKMILTDILTLMRDRGIYYIPLDAQGDPDITALGLLGAGDARMAIVAGKAFYAYNPSGANAPQGSINAQGGGVWDIVFVLPNNGVEYTKVIGDSVNTVFTLKHNLNTLYPTVLIYEVLTGLPYTSIDPTTYTVGVVDADNITVTTLTPIASLSQIVIVKQ